MSTRTPSLGCIRAKQQTNDIKHHAYLEVVPAVNYNRLRLREAKYVCGSVHL